VSRAPKAAHLSANALTVEAELAWLDEIMLARFSSYRGELIFPPDLAATAPDLDYASGPYADLVREMDLGPHERLILALALAPYVAPALLDPFLLQNQATGRRFTEFGGIHGQSHAGFLPTGETALFLLAGADYARRIALEPLLWADRPLRRRGVLLLDQRNPEEPPLSAGLRLSAQGIHRMLQGEDYAPHPGPDFPASLLATLLDWEDLVLDAQTLTQVEEIGRWIAHSTTLMRDWGLARRLKPGYRCLFHGGPGTGKTLTASLLGKRHGLPVYRVDISRVVSKWIGETEKNLASLFDQAEDRNWILFFDEADALFGKRTDANSANDRAANQQIAYLLQRLEDYSGLAILATNQHDYLDEAFARRFQSSIRFPMPDPEQRLRLWRESFASDGFDLDRDVDFEALAKRYELAGGAIINVLRYACLMAVERHPPIVHAHDLLTGVRREMQKDGRFISA
jgi:hypothetical protein